LSNYAIPNVVQKFSGVKVDLWHWLEKKVGNQDGTFELNQSKLADKFDVSRKAIQNALKTFQSANLIEKVESRTGRGNHPLYRLIWTFREESKKSATPSRVNKKPQEKNITKGSKTFRYYAYKFRTLVENSNLSRKASVIVGTTLDYLAGKPKEIFKQWLIYLRRWLEYSRTLKDFFVYFHRTLKKLAREKLGMKQTKQFIENQRNMKNRVKNEYEKDPPPRSKDFSRFSSYLKAMEEWES